MLRLEKESCTLYSLQLLVSIYSIYNTIRVYGHNITVKVPVKKRRGNFQSIPR